MDDQISLEKAVFVEEKAKQRLDYVLDCFDRVRTEGNSTLNWLFGAITGGIGLVGALFSRDYPALGVGGIVAILASVYAAMTLIRALKFRPIEGPGNNASALYPLLTETAAQLRLSEAFSMDQRIESNAEHLSLLSNSVEAAKTRLACLPIWFFGGTLVASLIVLLYHYVLIPIAKAACN